MTDLHLQPTEPPTNGSNPASGPTDQPASGPTTATVAAAAAAAATTATTTTTSSKRQRRPSVRLGDIGEQPAASDPYLRRATKNFRLPHSAPSSSVGPTANRIPNPNPNPTNNKTRTLPHLDTLSPSPADEGGGDANLETLAASIRNRNPKYPKRGRKARTGWTSSSKPEEDEDEGFRSEFDDLRRDDSLSPSDHDRIRHDPPPSDNEARDWNENGNIGLDEDGGVRSWLNRLGLGRYAPVFEIHEVDDEVLPLLTLEDLKDMGINAVGSRRKMYCAIQKLKKNFT